MYGAKWQRLRILFLNDNPLCKFCLQQGAVTQATVVDHKKPHKGSAVLFWDQGNWQPLCQPHHDSAKQAEERRGYSGAHGMDGWPLDARHPANVGLKVRKGRKSGKMHNYSKPWGGR